MSLPRPLVFDFVGEAKEHLANIADDLLALEQAGAGRPDEASRYRIDRLLRAVHSVKGGAGFFGCRTIGRLAQAMEAVLERLRDGGLLPEPAVIDTLLAGADRILALLDDVEHSNDADLGPLLERFEPLLPPAGGEVVRWWGGEGSAPAPGADLPAPTQDLTTQAPDGLVLFEALQAPGPADHAYLYGLTLDLADCQRRQGFSPAEVLRRLQGAGEVLDGRLEVPDFDLERPLPAGPVWYHAIVSAALPPDRLRRDLGLDGARIVVLSAPSGGGAVVRKPAAELAPQPPPAAPAPPPPTAAPPAPATGERASTLRIPVGLVDQLMTLVGELVLVRNQAVRTIDPGDPSLGPIARRLDGVTGALQGAVLRTRMQPVGNLFGKFPRLVRDLARQLCKQIALDIWGTEVELDKTILEALSDPLTHLVRNCCDHGIEPPEQRERAGKPPEGRVSLGARQLGGQICIEVRDDGRGIDPDRLRQKAQRVGLRTQAELARMGERELLGLILLPGFSTAPEVTDLSGRGVGMDVVKTNLEALGGALEIDSAVGRGTTMTLRLPLTLAIIPCLLVTADGQRYAIPQKDLQELVCLHPDHSPARIEHAYDQEVIRLRDRLLPLVRLAEVLRHSQPFTARTRAEVLRAHRRAAAGGQPAGGEAAVFIAVVRVGSQRYGLVVDEVLDTEEIVVKPVHASLRRLGIYQGATILGDGRVALILNMEGIARHAGCRTPAAAEAHAAEVGAEGPGAEAQTLLLFRCGPREQFAVPLAMVRRIERVPAERVQQVGEADAQEFVTVDGVPTRVLRLDRLLSVSPCEPRDEYLLLLPKNLRQPLGVLLTEILATETLALDVHKGAVRAAALVGSAVVRGRLTLLLDLFRLADLATGAGPGTLPAPSPAALPDGRRRVLLVEDTQFFRELVRGYLEGEGFEVTTANNGAEGLEQLDRQTFDLVVSDIEMPVLDGWGFARAVRRRPDGAGVRLLALTTLNSDEARERARESGFDSYEVKIDRERFLGAVAELLRPS
jgi:two-component system chemotaxis sensor kinase CheA